MTRLDGLERTSRGTRPRPPRGRFAFWITLAFAVAPAPAPANPVLERDAREMNERPARWLAHPTAEDERGLIAQFAAYGVPPSLLSPSTLKVLERNFDRFAPLMVAAQRPPRRPHPGLQSWYRRLANDAQAAAMKKTLRAWLSARVSEAPLRGGGRITGPPEIVEREILDARMTAAEMLGDWRDRNALPELRAMLGRLPDSDPVLVAAIRRISHPTRADALVAEPDRRLALRRPASELDSIVVSSTDEITREAVTWRADRSGIEQIWSSMDRGLEAGLRNEYVATERSSFVPRRVTMYYRDGMIASLEGSGGHWSYREEGRPNYRIEIVNPALTSVLLHELRRAGIAPPTPRFVRESVTLFIDPGELRVNGLYEFEGVAPDGWVPLRYPIAREEGLGPPRVDGIELRSLPEMKALPVSFDPEGPEWRIALTPGTAQACLLEVRYRQSLTGHSAKYLITTARDWRRPLHRGWFQVIIDSTLGEPRFDLPFYEVMERPGFRRFLFEASPFRPDSDLVVRW